MLLLQVSCQVSGSKVVIERPFKTIVAMSALLGRKIGMTNVFTEDGTSIPCTLVEVGPCTVVQVKSEESDGYDALQLGYGKSKEANLNGPMRGHLEKAGANAPRILREFRSFAIDQYTPGDVINATDVFAAGDFINVSATTKGKGFQGVVKRYNFSGVGMRTHGQSNRERAPGSVGQSSYPSRIFPGTRMGGRMGGKRTTVRNLQVIAFMGDTNVMIVKGAVPGAINSIVEICKNAQ